MIESKKVPMFDYRKCLESSGYKQKDIDAVRELIKEYNEVPKYILNGQVSDNYFVK
jgi:hypothetical protein